MTFRGILLAKPKKRGVCEENSFSGYKAFQEATLCGGCLAILLLPRNIIASWGFDHGSKALYGICTRIILLLIIAERDNNFPGLR